MNGSITPFLFEGEALVRVVSRDGEPWFVAADVCRVLGLSDPSKAVSRLEEDERGTNIVRTPSGDQQMIVINESGLYALILTSRKPQAKRFRKWVTADVLPSIRKTGGYGQEPHTPEQTVLPPDGDKRMFPDWTMDEMRTRRGVVDMYRMTYGVQSAQWIMSQLGFPAPPPGFIERGMQMPLPFTQAAE